MKVNGRGDACVERFFPAPNAQAPPVARAKAGETETRDGSNEVVAACAGEGEELVGHDGAHEVQAGVVLAGVAAAVAEKAGERVAATLLERLA